jgi:hypothetical protein
MTVSRRLRQPAALLCASAITGAAALTSSGAASAATAVKVNHVPGTTCPRFPADSVWHADISKLPLNAHSKAWIANMSGATRRLHPDFGPSYGAQPVPYGIPVTVVKAGHAKVTVRFDYAGESDKGPYPLGKDTKVEGGLNSGGDMHAIVVDASTCRLYETWDTQKTSAGWTAGSGAIWSLTSDKLRPAGWTSADAAGLPILPGLARYDEVRRGAINHALRFTVQRSQRAYISPARHYASSDTDPGLPPMGLRLRLKSSYSLARFHGQSRVILTALKRYGMLVADNGTSFYVTGASDRRWNDEDLNQLKTVPGSAFEAVQTGALHRG